MAPLPSALLSTDSVILPSSFLKQFLSAHPTASEDSVAFVTQAGLCGGKLPLPSGSLDAVLSLAEAPGHHSSSFLSELARVVKPGGTLTIQEPVGRRAATPEEVAKLGAKASLLQTQSSFEKLLLYAGFSSISSISPVVELGLAAEWTGITPASVGSTQGALLQPITLKVQKPQWERGTSFTLKKKSINASTAVANGNGTTVKLSLDDVDDAISSQPSQGRQIKPQPATWRVTEDDDDMADLVDEDSLLTAEDLAPPAAVPAEDCGTGGAGKKACKNCTCGRAEMEEAAPAKKLTLDQVNNPESACGSCGLGDAFRCAGCPYRGLPAFKLGEKIALPGSFLEADV